MRRLCVFVWLVAALTMSGTAVAQPGEEGVKLAHQTLQAAIKSGNLTMAQAMIHPSALGFFRSSENVSQLSSTFTPAAALPSVLSDLGRFTVLPFDATYRVTGTTGIVCMSARLQANKTEQNKKDKVQDVFLRSTWVYVNVDGNWKLFSWHTSQTPLKAKD